MTTCPKCGSWRIAGPSYRKDEQGERLQYQCVKCGYTESGLTLDAPDEAERFRHSVHDEIERTRSGMLHA